MYQQLDHKSYEEYSYCLNVGILSCGPSLLWLLVSMAHSLVPTACGFSHVSITALQLALSMLSLWNWQVEHFSLV